MLLASGGLFVVALGAATVLIVLCAALHHEAASIATADQRIRASLRTKVALLSYARVADLAASEHSPDSEREQAQAQRELYQQIDEVRRLATPQRLQQLDHLQQKVDQYVALRTRLAAQKAPVAEILRNGGPRLQATFADLERIIQSDDHWIDRLEASAHRTDRFAQLLGASVAALLLLGFTVSAGGALLLVYRPLVGVAGAMERFACGERSARASPNGAREIRRVAQTFNDMAGRLEQQDRDRITFLAGVAHDLRNPLSALKLITHPAAARAATMSPEKSARVMALVGQQVERLERMVGDLLEAARIEGGQLELQMQPIDLRLLVERVAELYRNVSPRHELSTHVPGSPVLLACDPTRIEQVLGNLVSNAVKYSPRGGPVTISLRHEGEAAIVEVVDHGEGVAPQELERIFEPFCRGGISDVPGAGLGLSVARKIVEAHHGRLEVTSAVGLGSTFRVLLPAPRVEAEQVAHLS